MVPARYLVRRGDGPLTAVVKDDVQPMLRGMHSRGLTLVLLLAGGVPRLAAQDGPPVRLPQAATGTAWDQSLALEARGDFTAAKQILIEAFGAAPARVALANSAALGLSITWYRNRVTTTTPRTA